MVEAISPRAFSRTRRSGASSCPSCGARVAMWSRSMRDYEGRVVGRVGGSAGARVRGRGFIRSGDRSSVRGRGADRHGADHHAVLHRRRARCSGAPSHQLRRGCRRSEAKTVSSRVSSISSDANASPRDVGVGVARAVSDRNSASFAMPNFVALYFMPIRIVECEYGSE